MLTKAACTQAHREKFNVNIAGGCGGDLLLALLWKGKKPSYLCK